MSKRAMGLGIVLAVVLLASCAPGSNEQTGNPGPYEGPAGFWKGLWHGFIVLFTFIISLFKENVGVYEVHNSGGWYDLGYLLGIMIFFGGGGKGSGCGRRKGG